MLCNTYCLTLYHLDPQPEVRPHLVYCCFPIAASNDSKYKDFLDVFLQFIEGIFDEMCTIYIVIFVYLRNLLKRRVFTVHYLSDAATMCNDATNEALHYNRGQYMMCAGNMQFQHKNK